MVKRQKEKQYQSRSELKSQSSSNNPGNNSSSIRKLPFDCCALSLLPFRTPVCTRNGILFDKTAIETFLDEHSRDPVTGDNMTKQDLIELHMDKDEEGRWQCPVLTKPFSDHTPIVAIVHGREANVYSQEAYQELNVKAKNYLDLISGEKFHKQKDVLFLNQNTPEFQKLRDINTFYHIRNQRQLEQAKPKTSSSNIRHSVTANRILERVNQDKKRSAQSNTSTNDKESLTKEGKRLKIFSDDVTSVKLTSGKGSGSFTSTAMNVQANNEAREATQEEILQSLFVVLKQQRKKGYVKLQTNHGDLLLEIHCDMVPRTATNFMKLCANGDYKNTKFHRLIPKFMIQGGSSSEEDDESVWGGEFKDEFHPKLKHNETGILSMANAGPNTNRRQFFITFAPCEYLNNKHSVFGVVVKGMDILKELEKIPTNAAKDKPLEPITILDTVVVENPVEEAEEKEQRRIEAKRNKKDSEKVIDNKKTTPESTKQAAASGIGRYLPKAAAQNNKSKDDDKLPALDLPVPAASKAKANNNKKPKMKFGNFSGW